MESRLHVDSEFDGGNPKDFPPELRAAAIKAYKEFLECLLMSNLKGSVEKTPERVTDAFIDFLYDKGTFTASTFSVPGRNMVTVKDIKFSSMCEHHCMPYMGKAHVSYIPEDRILGLSKVPRIVRFSSRRLSVQERLAELILQYVQKAASTQNVAVMLEATHTCMSCRGVMSDSTTFTDCLGGVFKEDAAVRAEFMRLVT